MRTGITGAEGFIGTHLAKRIDAPILFKGDLTILSEASEFVSECDRIYHLAGLNREEPGLILRNNLAATGNLVLSQILQDHHPEIVFASTMQVKWNPDSEYGLTKAIEEDIISRSKRWSIFRIPNVYGPGCKPFYNSVVATFCHQISKGLDVTVNDPDATREFIFIDTLIDVLLEPEFDKRLEPPAEALSIGQIHSYLTDRLGEHRELELTLNSYKETG